MVGRDRASEEEPLAELAAQPAQPVELGRLLDPLGDDPQPERLAHGHDGMGERPCLGVGVAGHDEVAGDLEDVDREPAQVAEGAVAGPEVVDRDPDAERPDAPAGGRSS